MRSPQPRVFALFWVLFMAHDVSALKPQLNP
jgi:hypothetical protein